MGLVNSFWFIFVQVAVSVSYRYRDLCFSREITNVVLSQILDI